VGGGPLLAAQALLGRSPLQQRHRERGSRRAQTMKPFPPGYVLQKRYKIVSLLGQGGMGAVYEAQQIPLGRVVALKVMCLPNTQGEQRQLFEQRFFLEASLCARLSHPNVVTIFDYGLGEDGNYFIAMERLTGQTLEARLAEKPSGLPPAEVVRIAVELCRGLREAHGKGLVHRDLKPANVILAPGEDGQTRVKILDFGLVKSTDAEAAHGLTQIGVVVGTPFYMAPEQASEKPIDARADLYAFGVMLFELLTGQVPYEGKDLVDILVKKSNNPAPLLRVFRPRLQVSEALESLVAALLRADPDHRPGSAEELLKALRALPESASLSGATPARPRTPASIPVAARYQLGRLISGSARAQVFEATHTELGRKVAVKIYTPSGEQRAARLRRELPALAQLAHPVNTQVFDVGTARFDERQVPFVAMELVRGTVLADLLGPTYPLEPARTVNIARQILLALAEVHRSGQVHRNLSVDHVLLLSEPDGTERVKLVGHGVSAAADEGGTGRQDARSALAHVTRSAPEVLRGGRRTEASDIYALGAVLHECLCGRPTFDLAQLEAFTDAGEFPTPAQFDPPPGVSPRLTAIVVRAMSPLPSDRYATAIEMLEALATVPEWFASERDEGPASSRLATVSASHRLLWSTGTETIWVLGDDPAFRKATVRAALADLRSSFDVIDIAPGERDEMIARIRTGEAAMPWAVLFGDMSVLLEDPLLAVLGRAGELSRVLISTHANTELLQQSINFCGLDYQICLPETSEAIFAGVATMIERARAVRSHYDELRRLLGASGEVATRRAAMGTTVGESSIFHQRSR
jgi:serine/threonine protein kinase